VMRWIERFKSAPYFSSEGWETDEKHLKRWRTFSEPKTSKVSGHLESQWHPVCLFWKCFSVLFHM